jgi:tetratricopeptide (TPR) repeat protein
MRGDAASLGQVLHRETNGNPFFIGEVVHLLSGEEASFGGSVLVPHGVREVIAQRLDRLGDDCRRTLAVAALCGDTIDARLLSEVLDGLPTADYLVRSVRDRILVDAEGRYAFAHALIRRVLVDEMAPSMRAAWHDRIAAVLERQATVVTTELVRHLAAAGTPEALRKAFEYACRGAEEAANGLGWEEAARLWQIALDVGKRSGLLDTARRNALRLALARALRGAGDVPAARRLCDEVMAACRRPVDPDSFARAALVYAGAMPEWGKVEPPVRAVLEEACRHGEELEDALRARLYARLAGDLVAANEIEQGPRVFALAEEAATAARRANAPGPLSIALLASYLALGIRMRPAPDMVLALPNPDEMLDAARAGGEHEIEAAIRYARAMAMFAFGEPEAFAAEVDGLSTFAAETRVPEAVWLADALVALGTMIQGRFDDAWEAMDRIAARFTALPNVAGVLATQRIMWAAFQGRLGEFASEIDAFVDTQFAGPGWRPIRALSRLASGDAVAARAEFEEMIAAGLGAADRGVMSRMYLMGLAVLCVSLGDRERAPLIYERIARRKEAWSIDGCVTLGPWSIALAALARLSGRPEEAVRHYEAAIREGRRMGARPIVARASSLLASLRLSLGAFGEEQSVVAEMLDEAGQGAQEMGLADVAARVARLRAKLAKRVEPAAAFRNEGDVWVARYAGCEVRVRDGKGARYLATLLATPGREVHVLQLAADSAVPVATGLEDGLAVGLPGGAIDEAPDERARERYRERLAELRAELDEAELFADAGRVERLRGELEQLTDQLVARPVLQGPAETARKAVTKVLRTQIGKLLEVHPFLGRHLRDSVRLGTTCVYAPTTAVEWDVGFEPAETATAGR